jgi:hypothetical protein
MMAMSSASHHHGDVSASFTTAPVLILLKGNPALPPPKALQLNCLIDLKLLLVWCHPSSVWGDKKTKRGKRFLTFLIILGKAVDKRTREVARKDQFHDRDIIPIHIDDHIHILQ